ncbi:MAG: hypothetical protein HQ572_04285, partial [Candidatus Omnitrophica bacterium]|nr:hypothetical protein [Candidatus Omnitrophota bacterium]
MRNNYSLYAIRYPLIVCLLLTTGCGRGLSKLEETPSFNLSDKGSEYIVNYAKYGKFENIGSSKYKYTITDQAGLSKAVGEGIHPNASSVLKDPEYKTFKKKNKLQGSHWDFIN